MDWHRFAELLNYGVRVVVLSEIFQHLLPMLHLSITGILLALILLLQSGSSAKSKLTEQRVTSLVGTVGSNATNIGVQTGRVNTLSGASTTTNGLPNGGLTGQSGNNGLSDGTITGTSGSQSAGTAHTHSPGSYRVSNGLHVHDPGSYSVVNGQHAHNLPSV